MLKSEKCIVDLEEVEYVTLVYRNVEGAEGRIKPQEAHTTLVHTTVKDGETSRKRRAPKVPPPVRVWRSIKEWEEKREPLNERYTQVVYTIVRDGEETEDDDEPSEKLIKLVYKHNSPIKSGE